MGDDHGIQFSALTFFRQRRLDDGERFGISLRDGYPVESFQPGEEEFDPSIIWSIDLRCDGEGIPTDATEAIDWLKSHLTEIQHAFQKLSDHLVSGIDPTGWGLLKWNDFPSPSGVTMSIYLGAMRTVDGRQNSKRLAETAENLPEYLEKLVHAPSGTAY